MRRAALLPLLPALAAGCRQDARAGGLDVVDAAVVAAAPVAAPPPSAPAPAPAPAPGPRALRYPDDRTLSPIGPDVAERLRAIAARHPEDEHVFAKFGDSITDSEAFLDCLSGSRVDLGDRADLAGTLAWFRAGRVNGGNPYTRESLAAITGWASRGPLGGRPSALEREVATIAPRYAVVMFGTNDVDYRRIDQFATDMWTIVDELAARGVIPLLSTIPPIDHRPRPAARVPLFNRVVRALAEGRALPLVDLYRAMLALPAHGLRDDGVHPSEPSSLGACAFTPAGLRWGYDVRNLLTLDVLDRARRALAGEAPDAATPAQPGAGRAADPFVVDALPYAQLSDTRTGEARVDRYACDPGHDEGGPEVVYRVDLPAATRLRARVVTRGAVDVDVHLVAGDACVARGDRAAAATVGPGPVDVVVDTYVDHAGVAHAGEFLLVLEAE